MGDEIKCAKLQNYAFRTEQTQNQWAGWSWRKPTQSRTYGSRWQQHWNLESNGKDSTLTNKQKVPLQRPSCVQKAVHTVCQAAPWIWDARIFPNISCRQGDPREILAKSHDYDVQSERQNVEGKVERNMYGHPRTKERETRHGTGVQDIEQNQHCEEWIIFHNGLRKRTDTNQSNKKSENRAKKDNVQYENSGEVDKSRSRTIRSKVPVPV